MIVHKVHSVHQVHLPRNISQCCIDFDHCGLQPARSPACVTGRSFRKGRRIYRTPLSKTRPGTEEAMNDLTETTLEQTTLGLFESL